MNDWLKLENVTSGYHTITSNDAESELTDFSFFAKASYMTELDTMEAECETPVYDLQDEYEHFIKWRKPQSGNNDYEWRVIPYTIAKNSVCTEAQLAKIGTNTSVYAAGNLFYKLRVDEPGRYLISGNTKDIDKLNMYSVMLLRGDCEHGEYMQYVDMRDIQNSQADNFSFKIDSISDELTFFIRWKNINISGVPEGVYIVTLKMGTHIYHEKIRIVSGG